MSQHPNAILAVRLTPNDLTRKTYREICVTVDTDPEDGNFQLAEDRYSIVIMEDSYDDSWQIGAEEGDLVAHTFLTYGYGENCSWNKVKDKAERLEQWAKEICGKHSCEYELFITANYW